VSAGLSLLADRAMGELGADFAIANELLFEGGRVTGGVRVHVSLANKQAVIRELAFKNGCDLNSCVVVGDSAEDIPEDAALRIAFSPKDEQALLRAHAVVEEDLTRILPYVVSTEPALSKGHDDG